MFDFFQILVAQTPCEWTLYKTFLFLTFSSKVKPSSQPQRTPSELFKDFGMESALVALKYFFSQSSIFHVAHFFRQK